MATRVLIAGGGVAAMEAMLALHALAGTRVEVELLSPEQHFWYRPLSVGEPFGAGEATRHEVGALAAAAGGALVTLGALRGVDTDRNEATTSVGEIAYDVLLVAVGAVPVRAVPGALIFRGPSDDEKIAGLLAEVRAGAVRRIAFAVPAGVSWPLPLYELALLTASNLRANGRDDVELALVTPEQEPLQLFGPRGSSAVRRLLDERAIALHTGRRPFVHADEELRLVDGGAIDADRVVTVPLLRGLRLSGLPATSDGFIPIDAHGRVDGLVDVYAAGDAADCPVKQGGIAAQVADAAAEAIAARVGAAVTPRPFRPVLRALLLTGAEPLYLRRDLSDERRGETVAPARLRQPAKIQSRYLEPFLESLTRPSPPATSRRPD